MVGGDARGSRPLPFRRELAAAISAAALGTSAGPVPFLYVVDLLARRYGIAPWDVRDAPYEDVMRAMHIMNVEAEVQVHRG